MSDLPENYLVRPEADDGFLSRAIASAMSIVAERHLVFWTVAASGWFVAVLLTWPLVKMMNIVENRPVPQDRIFVSFVDHVTHLPVSEPVETTQLKADDKLSILQAFATNYVIHRLTYDYGNQQHDFDQTRLTTQGQAQIDYVKETLDGPATPYKTYGVLGKQVVAWVGEPHPTGPYSVTVPYTLNVVDREGHPKPDVHGNAIIDYRRDPSMPGIVATRTNDPLRLVVFGFAKEPATFDPAKFGGLGGQ